MYKSPQTKSKSSWQPSVTKMQGADSSDQKS